MLVGIEKVGYLRLRPENHVALRGGLSVATVRPRTPSNTVLPFQ
jgi:hypothetical protein